MVSGDTLTAVARNMQIVAHDQGVAFAAVRSDGSVQTWGCKEDGGDSRAVKLGTSSFIIDNISVRRVRRGVSREGWKPEQIDTSFFMILACLPSIR